MKELLANIKNLVEDVKKAHKYFSTEELEKEIGNMETKMHEENFWRDREKAEKISREFDRKKSMLDIWKSLRRESGELFELAKITSDGETEEQELEEQYKKLKDKFDKNYVHLFLNGKYDSHNALLTVNAGTGGTDAQDWANMLFRMYIRFAEAQGYKTNLIHKSYGQEAGIKSATMEITGEFAYGYLKCEAGTHRLVRLSPFNTGKTRETSFASVEVVPELQASDDIEIEEKDLRIDTFRSQGHGGQSVNTTDSAVRVTHIPTNIVVTCQNERSQLQNKETAFKVLKSKLQHLKEKEKEQETNKLKANPRSASWGDQIRSYILHPYKMAKDLRTGVEISKVNEVLDGRINEFIEAYLLKFGSKSKT